MNLVIGVVGDSSLHYTWLRSKPDFDLFLVYYGDDDQIALKYKQQAKRFFRKKGTKFNIIGEIYDELPIEDYNYVFIPDDDLYMSTATINRVFELAVEYNLELCQPGIFGYHSVGFTIAVPQSLLRYTNFVEVMCPCFSRDAFEKCNFTFNKTVSCWCIDMWWDKILGFPRNKIAILDDVVAVHTRPCFSGDFYSNNEIKDHPINDCYELVRREDLSFDKVEYDRIYKEVTSINPEDRHFPHEEFVKVICQSLRERKLYL